MTQKSIRVFQDATELAEACSSDLFEYLHDIKLLANRSARVVLTGGRMGLAVVSAMAHDEAKLLRLSPWITWGDERLVPLSSPDSNSGEALRRFPALAALKQYRYPLSESLTLSRDQADAELAEVLNPLEAAPLFDLVLLGIGEDGHVASIFPDQPAPDPGAHGIVAATDSSPKPPRLRLTLTEAALNRSRHVWFLASGFEKRAAVKQSFDDNRVAASRVRGLEETRWYLDRASDPSVS